MSLIVDFRLGYKTAHPLDLESGKLPILAILQGKNACKGLPKIAPPFDIGEHCLSHWEWCLIGQLPLTILTSRGNSPLNCAYRRLHRSSVSS